MALNRWWSAAIGVKRLDTGDGAGIQASVLSWKYA